MLKRLSLLSLALVFICQTFATAIPGSTVVKGIEKLNYSQAKQEVPVAVFDLVLTSEELDETDSPDNNDFYQIVWATQVSERVEYINLQQIEDSPFAYRTTPACRAFTCVYLI
jgi:hypothetical protein